MNQKFLNNALDFAQQSKWHKALAIYEALLKNEPDNIELINKISIIYSQIGEYTKAYEWMEKILDRKTTDAEFISNFSAVLPRPWSNRHSLQ